MPKVFHDWGYDIITIQKMGTIKTLLVTKKLVTPTKWLEVLMCYDFHYGISNKKEDLMFATKLRLFQ